MTSDPLGTEHFPFFVERRWRVPLLFWGVKRRPYVELTADGRMVVRFGWWDVATPVSNMRDHRITGPYRWWSAIGVRRSVRHGDGSFCSTDRRGVFVTFRERVPFAPIFRVPALTVTVADVEAFSTALERRGVPLVPDIDEPIGPAAS
jgi:hypothetical protein